MSKNMRFIFIKTKCHDEERLSSIRKRVIDHSGKFAYDDSSEIPLHTMG